MPIKSLSSLLAAVVLTATCLASFLLVISFGNAPAALGLDPAWTEVLAWGFLHAAQWGRDLVFTYGPLGFLTPSAAYFSGSFPWYVAGNVLLSAAFALSIGLLLLRSGLGLILLFASLLACSFWRLPGDISCALTLLFATMFLVRCNKEGKRTTLLLAIVVFAPLFAAISLIKFSLFPLWALCVATLAAVCGFAGNPRSALFVLVAFPLALLLVWAACGQEIGNLPQYLSLSSEIAYGYRHAMGVDAPLVVELSGFAVLSLFAGLCAHAAWRMRANWTASVSAIVPALAALLFWFAFFTRGDEFHWPSFFAAMSLVPFALLCNPYLASQRFTTIFLVALMLACASVGMVQANRFNVLDLAIFKIGQTLQGLTHLENLQNDRETQWRDVGNNEALPKIRARVGTERIDMVTWQQGMILVNGMNYAPRPVFQSYSAYTPRLARLNEEYFLGDAAPGFVLLRLDYSDGRLPPTEDGLALLAMLRRYRPTLVERGFVLLERDAKIRSADAVAPMDAGTPAQLGSEFKISLDGNPAIGFIRVELNTFGKLYTLLFQEPALSIVLKTDDSQTLRHRLIRLTAESGFLINPLVRSSQDWIKLYLSKPLPRIVSLRVETELPWERSMFKPEISFATRTVAVLTHASADRSASPAVSLYPEFSIPPESPADLRIIDEDGVESAFLHAPASVLFRPAAGNYVVSATYGLQSAAVNDSECLKANPDGVGVSVVRKHAGSETVLWHVEVDPFHVTSDIGPRRFRIEGMDIEDGDELEYRIDPGHGGRNVSCDWSYVRDMVFKRNGDVGFAKARSGLIFADDFE